MERRFTFDAVAGVYRAVRPDYPEALFDDVVGYAGLRPDDSILEVGCGTGQATRGFARRGYAIVAIDPGPEMLRNPVTASRASRMSSSRTPPSRRSGVPGCSG